MLKRQGSVGISSWNGSNGGSHFFFNLPSTQLTHCWWVSYLTFSIYHVSTLILAQASPAGPPCPTHQPHQVPLQWCSHPTTLSRQPQRPPKLLPHEEVLALPTSSTLVTPHNQLYQGQPPPTSVPTSCVTQPK